MNEINIRKRFGKDLRISFDVRTNGELLPLEGRDLVLELVAPFGVRTSVPFTVSGSRITFHFLGRDQKTTGNYRMTLWENLGKEGQSVVDTCDGFTLVACSCQESDGGTEGLEVESIDLGTVDMTVGVRGDSAYETWLKYGHEGTEEDFIAWLRQPAVDAAEKADKAVQEVESLVGDWDEAKRLLADALTKQGIPTTPDESFNEMAAKLESLYVVDEGDPSLKLPSSTGLPIYDLFNEMRNHKRADFPYVAGVRTTKRKVTLKGAEAYLCSDGFFTTESGVEHEFTDAKQIESYILYYFSNADYVLPTNIPDVLECSALNGRPIILTGNDSPGYVNVYTDDEDYELKSTAEINIYNSSKIVGIAINGLKVSGGYIANNCSNLTDITLPALQTISGGSVAGNCSNLTDITLPALQTISGGYVAGNCSNLTDITLPALQTISGGYVAGNCSNLTDITLPALQTISGGSVADSCLNLTDITLPALQTISGGYVAYSCSNLTEVNLPALLEVSTTAANRGFFYFQRMLTAEKRLDIRIEKLEIYMSKLCFVDSALSDDFVIAAHLGAPQGGSLNFSGYGTSKAEAGIKELHVKEGFRSYLNISTWKYLGVEYLRDLLAKLGDNTSYETINIVLGIENLAKLTDEEKQIAIDKNYSLS